MTEGVLLRSVILNCTILIVASMFMLDFLARFRETDELYWGIAAASQAALAVFLIVRTSVLSVQQAP